jgi:hypothetical protein
MTRRVEAPRSEIVGLFVQAASFAKPDVQDLYRRLAVSPQIIKPQHCVPPPLHSDYKNTRMPIPLTKNNFVSQILEVGLTART